MNRTLSVCIKVVHCKMDELHADNPTWGSCKLRDKLRLEGYKVNRKHIQRLIGMMEWQTIDQKPNPGRLEPGSKVFPVKGLSSR